MRTQRTNDTTVGVLGVGSMGRHHARVYNEIPGTRLYGVVDADESRAEEVASAYDARATEIDELLAEVDAVSVAVPTEYHAGVTERCIEHGVDVLVEKPFVVDRDAGNELVQRADERDVLIQVGHVERFNPAFETIANLVGDLSIVALSTRRLGPPIDRFSSNVVFDLMIHDLDVIREIIDSEVEEIDASGTADGEYATATIGFTDGTIARLTASRATQRKVRKLQITAEELLVDVDYLDQTVELHRQSVPEYVRSEEGVRFRHEGVVERPMVENGEPLRNELESFVDSVRTRKEPEVTGEDGLRAVELAEAIHGRAFGEHEDAEGPIEVESE